MSESFQFTAQPDPILGADRRNETFVRFLPGGKGASESVLPSVRNGQKPLPLRSAI